MTKKKTFLIKLTKLKLKVRKFDFQCKKNKDMNTDKLIFNWQNFARVRLQIKFAFIIWPLLNAESIVRRATRYLRWRK